MKIRKVACYAASYILIVVPLTTVVLMLGLFLTAPSSLGSNTEETAVVLILLSMFFVFMFLLVGLGIWLRSEADIDETWPPSIAR